MKACYIVWDHSAILKNDGQDKKNVFPLSTTVHHKCIVSILLIPTTLLAELMLKKIEVSHALQSLLFEATPANASTEEQKSHNDFRHLSKAECKTDNLERFKLVRMLDNICTVVGQT